MGALIGTLGAYGYADLSSAADMVTGTYDGPLMAINYARAASVDFVQMQQQVLRRRLSAPVGHVKIDAKIDNLTATFFDDLDVAQERLTAADEHKVVADIRRLVEHWKNTWRQKESGNADSRIDALDRKIMDKFDMLIELNADHSFVGRRKAVRSNRDFKSSLTWITLGAMLLALLITAFLARRIMRPLSSAVSAADRIAGGEFETPIPQAGKDETGILLTSMTVMQDNIRTMVVREKERGVRRSETGKRARHVAGRRVAHRSRWMCAGGEQADARLLSKRCRRPHYRHEVQRCIAGRRSGRRRRRGAPTPAELGLGRRARSLGSAERQLKDGRWIRTVGSRTSDGGFIFFVSDFSAIKEREENARRARARLQRPRAQPNRASSPI